MWIRHGRWCHPFTIAVSHFLLAMTVACGQRSGAPPRPNVLLVTIDTFRADRIGTGVAPTIDQLAAGSVRFTTARSAVPLTLPSHTTILTGLLPPAHGVRENGVDALADRHKTIATVMKAAGYDTAAFVGAFVLDHRFGLAQGFDTYDDQIPRDPNATERLEAERPASVVVDRALAWLERRRDPSVPPAAPFFLWLHLYDPHAPYRPPPEFLARSRTPYDGEIAYADAQFARMLGALRARTLLDHTIVVVAGDHGEGLGEHGERTHGMLLYDSTLRVPLIISAPGHNVATRPDPVSLVDLAPTILRAAGITPPDEMKGRDLLSTVRLKPATTDADPKQDTNDAGAKQDLYSETEYPRVAGWSPLQALTDGRWMTIRAAAATEVYDLQNDPREEHDVAEPQHSIADAMADRAEAIHGSAPSSSANTISPEARERLRSLGYVAASSSYTGDSRAPNPSGRIAVWNEFEDGLSAMSSHQPGAAATLRRLAAANPDALVMQTTLARALKEEGKFDAALAVYRQTVKRWPTDAVLLHDLAVTAREAAGGRTGPGATVLRDEALRADQAALTLEPDSAPALNGVGLLAIDEGKVDQAVKAFERATALDSNNAGYWANLGNARRAAGDHAAAEQAYRRALAVDPRSVDPANGLAVLLVEVGRPGDAVPLLEQAVTAAPDFVEARLNLGIALQGTGRGERAAEEYRLVLAARGSHPREKNAAARLLAAMGAAR